MQIELGLPLLLTMAWLMPLGSFVAILFWGPRMGQGGKQAAHLATAAIFGSCFLSFASLTIWLANFPVGAAEHGVAHLAPPPVSGDWYSLGAFGTLRLSIGYYIDALTLAMFCMVTLVASCIHVYSFGYMHGELSDVIDGDAPLANGQPLRRRGRFYRFYQYLSLFCFSMLGLILAGNMAMVFMFWELVGICSYLLIGFWHERKRASNAANKAFIVNRVGDFGMMIGMMVLWTGLGTFSFGDYVVTTTGVDADGQSYQTMTQEQGIFSQVRPVGNDYKLQVPDGMVRLAKQAEIAEIVKRHGGDTSATNEEIAARLPRWREQGFGYGLLVVAGLGIFCGCIGKSAQFPLHVWLPDAMEGPTPVSALIHAATMVAAGVYLVGRFYPVFPPEVLLVVACIGCITLFMAATIALTATDIKRVLAYSTVSQLGFMMLALGVGGWLAGMFHLLTHAFFKSLLFLCSGSVIHACGTNEMPAMGGLRKKMPVTAMTMLIGCLAIAGAGIPTIIGLSGIGLSGFHSKDYIFAQVYSFRSANPFWGGLFFYAAAAGACMTAFYMFRLWYLTFAGNPRDGHVHHHAHESPMQMTLPLVILAFFAVVAAWNIPWTGIGLDPLLRQAQPAGTAEGMAGGAMLTHLTIPPEEAAHQGSNKLIAEWSAFAVALLGFVLATLFYGTRKLDPADVQRTFSPIYKFLVRKWMFDELYAFLFIRPLLQVSRWVAAIDQRGIDWVVDGSARLVEWISRLDNWIDRVFIDAPVNLTARWTYALGMKLRVLQTGDIHHYVMWIAAGLVGFYVLMSL